MEQSDRGERHSKKSWKHSWQTGTMRSKVNPDKVVISPACGLREGIREEVTSELSFQATTQFAKRQCWPGAVYPPHTHIGGNSSTPRPEFPALPEHCHFWSLFHCSATLPATFPGLFLHRALTLVRSEVHTTYPDVVSICQMNEWQQLGGDSASEKEDGHSNLRDTAGAGAGAGLEGRAFSSR